MFSPELVDPWEYKNLSEEERQAYDDRLVKLEESINTAKSVRNYIRDEEYYESTDSPLKGVVQQMYERKVAAGQMPPRPE